MALHSFAMGLATVLFETAASALFVARFGAAALPWVYIAAAFVNTGAGAVFSAARAHLPFRRLMAAMLLLLLAAVVSLRVGLALSGAATLVFLLLVFYRVLSVLTDLEYWAVAGHLYDVRQAKRLFGLIGTGEVIARIAGSFAVPLLVAGFGVPNLLWLSAGALALCWLVLLRVLPRDAAEAPRPGRRPAESEGRSTRALWRDPYLRQLFALALFGVLAKYFVDFAFLAETREHTADVAAFASFFGLFSGLTQVLSLLTRIFVSGPLLTRFGIRSGLIVLPLTHLVCTVFILAASVLPGAGAAVFWLVVGNQGVYKVLKHPIDNPCFKVLYQPLARRDRLSAQVAVETVVTPVTTGFAGIVMLLFAKTGHVDPFAFAWVLLATFLLWAAVASRVGRAYAGALVRALQGRLVHGESLELGDDESRRAVEAALESERPSDVLFALDLLERDAPKRVGRKLAELISHPASDVRRTAISRLERRGDRAVAGLLAHRLGVEPSPEVRVAALSALVTLQGAEAASLLAPFLTDPDGRVRVAALGGLVRTSGGKDSPWRAEVLRRAVSPRAEDRLDAAHVIAVSERGVFDSPLVRLLADDDRGVRRAALQATARAGGPEVWPDVVASLPDRPTSGAAVAALLAGGQAALTHVGYALQAEAEPFVQVRLLRVAAAAGAETASALVLPHVDSAHASVRQAALAGLVAAGYRFADAARPAVLEAMRAEARQAAWVMAAARDLQGDAASDLVRAALDWEADLCRERTLLRLSCAHDPKALGRVREGLGHAAPEKHALALEVLDVTLQAEEREVALPLCEAGDRRRGALLALFPQETMGRAARLGDLIRFGSGVRPFTRAAALYAVAGSRLHELGPEVDAVRAERGSPLVADTAAFAQAALRDGESGKGSQRPMLTIEKVITLKAARMFEEAPPDILAEVAAILEETQAKAGAAVFAKGDGGDSMYIIAEGRMRVSDGERTVVELGPGEVFGELALLDPEPRLYTVAALEDSRLLRLDREAFLELMSGNIEIVRGVLHVLCERLRQAETGVMAERR